MNSQKGMATLLVTTMLLVVSLLFSLASYKNTFYQIKRTQNEVLARQAHWAAEGGLECGFTKIINLNDTSANLDSCKTIVTDLDGLSVSGTNPYTLTSKVDNKFLRKGIELSGGESSGVVKSSADLYFNGDYAFFPDPGNLKETEKWQCVFLRYKSKLFIHNDSTSGIGSSDLNHAKAPYSGFFSDSWNHKCFHNPSTSVSYKTALNSKMVSDFASDIQKVTTMNLFKETFGVSRDKWETIRNKDEFIKLDVTGNCGVEIANEISIENKSHVWVDGNCILDSEGLTALVPKAQSKGGILIVVHNGIFSFDGASELNALIYHFINDYNPYVGGVNAWSSTTLSGKVLDDTMYNPAEGSLTASEIKNRVVFYMYGSFAPSGGFIFDTPNYVSYLNASGSLDFDGDLIEKILGPFSEPRWIEGSWRDF